MNFCSKYTGGRRTVSARGPLNPHHLSCTDFLQAFGASTQAFSRPWYSRSVTACAAGLSRPQAARPRFLPVTAAAGGTGPEAPAAPASERTRGRGPGCSPPPAAPPLTCPVRVCRERKSSQSTSRVRRGLELRSGVLSLLLEELGSAAAAMTPSRQTPTAAASARPHPSLAGFVALRWRKTTASAFALRVRPTLSVWQTRTGTNQEQDSRARRVCGGLTVARWDLLVMFLEGRCGLEV